MSKQQGYQPLSTQVPNGEDYGFAARLAQAGGSYPNATDGTHDAGLRASGASGVAPAAPPVAYPAAAYAGAPMAGYPAIPMTGPAGVVYVVQDPLGKCGRKRARRMACAANGCRGCRRCRGCHGCRRRRGGPLHLLFGLAESAFHSVQDHRRRQPPAPAYKPGSGSQ